jgi:N-acetylglucosaminyldiphosphoundecaprenol N-acetyl-beta-D-mannosaminyltransferase
VRCKVDIVMNKYIDVAGLRISTLTKKALLAELSTRLKAGKKTFIITPYSEFLYAVLHRPDLVSELNQADFSLADGIGVLWASYFLKRPFRSAGYYTKILEAVWQIIWSGASILIKPNLIKKYIPEKIVGADLVWDLAGLANQQGKSIYILGGFDDTPELVKKELQIRFPSLAILGASNKGPEDQTVLADIKGLCPDMLFVAYGPIRQDVWIANNLESLPVGIAVGLGGTFDYISGKKIPPPQIIRRIGLEWLYRLCTQPSRLKRIRNATIGLIISLLRYKVFTSQPLRQNVVVVIINRQQKILVCKRKYELKKDGDIAFKFQNYWQFPQGGVDDGEALLSAAEREAFEETGLTSLSLIMISKHAHQYDWRNGARPLLFNRLKFRGQDQRIVYLRHQGTDDDVKLDNREFEDYQWVHQEQLEGILHPERKPLVTIAMSDLRDL